MTAALLTDKKMYNKKRYFNSQGLAKPDVTFGMNDNTDLDSFTPNFGVIETDEDGRNVIETGIYNLTADLETGALSQTDTDYLITTKKERRISRVFENASLGDAKLCPYERVYLKKPLFERRDICYGNKRQQSKTESM